MIYALRNNTDFPVLTAIGDKEATLKFCRQYYSREPGSLYHEQWYTLDGYEAGDERCPWLDWKEVDSPLTEEA